MKKNLNFTNIGNIDDRQLQKTLIQSLEKEPDIAIISASPLMQAGSDFFPGSYLINNYVGCMQLEDLLAIYFIYLKSHQIPKTIILGLNCWLLNDNSNRDNWKTIKEEYFEATDSLEVPVPPSKTFNLRIPEKYLQLVSLSYLQQSLPYLKLRYSSTSPSVTKDSFNLEYTKLPDGSIVVDKIHRDISFEEVDQRAMRARDGYHLDTYNRISNMRLKLLRNFISFAQKKGSSVRLFIPPFHPIVYNHIKQNYPIVLQTEELFRNMALETHCEMIGSFNPSVDNLTNVDFIDPIYLKREILKTIMTNPVNKLLTNKENL